MAFFVVGCTFRALVEADVVRGAKLDAGPKALDDVPYLHKRQKPENNSGAELHAEVHHVQEGSSLKKHYIDLHRLAEPQDICADGSFEPAGGGGCLFAHLTVLGNVLDRAARCWDGWFSRGLAWDLFSRRHEWMAEVAIDFTKLPQHLWCKENVVDVPLMHEEVVLYFKIPASPSMSCEGMLY